MRPPTPASQPKGGWKLGEDSFLSFPHISGEDTHSPVFTAAVFTIAKTWKQPKCPQTDEWIKKMWYIYTTEYYSAIEKECSNMDGPRDYHTK